MKQLKRNNRMCETVHLRKNNLDVDAVSGFSNIDFHEEKKTVKLEQKPLNNN